MPSVRHGSGVLRGLVPPKSAGVELTQETPINQRRGNRKSRGYFTDIVSAWGTMRDHESLTSARDPGPALPWSGRTRRFL